VVLLSIEALLEPCNFSFFIESRCTVSSYPSSSCIILHHSDALREPNVPTARMGLINRYNK
jgi:hypothetical protein